MSAVLMGRLAGNCASRHHGHVLDDEATTLMLEALFDIKVAAFEIHGALFGEDDEEEEEEDEDA